MQTLRIPPMHKAALVLTPLQPDGEPEPIDGDPIYELDTIVTSKRPTSGATR